MVSPCSLIQPALRLRGRGRFHLLHLPLYCLRPYSYNGQSSAIFLVPVCADESTSSMSLANLLACVSEN